MRKLVPTRPSVNSFPRVHGVSREQVLASAASPPREPVTCLKSGMPVTG
jgi:hypothetical protein